MRRGNLDEVQEATGDFITNWELPRKLRNHDISIDHVRLLARAILSDAIECLKRNSPIPQQRKKGYLDYAEREAREWIKGGEVEYPCFGFEEVCWLLNLDEEATRDRLLGGIRPKLRRRTS